MIPRDDPLFRPWSAAACRGLRRRDDEIRRDLRPEEQRDQRLYVTYWFPLTGDLCERGENQLGVRLIGSDASVRENILIEEVEVFIVPRFDSPLDSISQQRSF